MTLVQWRTPASGLLAALAVVALGLVTACGSAVPVTGLATSSTTCSTPGPQTQQDSFSTPVSLTAAPSGLRYGDVRVGCGREVKTGDTVSVAYTGWLANGTKFDTSRAPGRQPISFVEGAGQVITGFDDGLLGMRVGGKRRIVIPPAMGFGAQGRPPVIPPNATLVFDVEVVSVS